MLKNYLKIAWRNLFRQKTYSLLNLLGLAIGISCGLLLTLHIREELSYEKDFPRHRLIYRLASTEWSKSSPPVGGELQQFFPEIDGVARFADRGTEVVKAGPNVQGESKGYFADSSVIDVFDIKAVAGNPTDALRQPDAIVITRSMARKYFGNRDPLNQQMTFSDEEKKWVRAVIEDQPTNSHIRFDYLASMAGLYQHLSARQLNARGWMFGWTYCVFRDEAAAAKAKTRLEDFFMKFYADWGTPDEITPEARKWRFQPITDIHLRSNLIQEMGPNSSMIYVYIFIGVQVLILLIACVNFINLFTTQALKRIKEVGIRKILGANRGRLVLQFMGEAFILTLLAAILAVALYQAALPFYNRLSGNTVSLFELVKPVNLLLIGGMVLITGLLSGIFPALFVTRFGAVRSLKAHQMPGSSAAWLRKGLVVFQFVVSGLLIISTVLIYQQTQLFSEKELGFDRNNVIVARLYGNLKEQAVKHPDVLEQALRRHPEVTGIAKASNIIGDGLSVETITPLNPPPGKEYASMQVMRVDDHYLDVMKIPVTSGRNFSRTFNDTNAYIINEKAAALLGLKDPIGAPILNQAMGAQGRIVGIIKDFHFASLHQQIEPLALEYKPEWTNGLLIKTNTANTASLIGALEKDLKAIAPGTLFSHGFLDDRISGLYKKENSMSSVLQVFAVLAIVLSCLGLFGLIAHATETRTKEIGIRKVVGAGIGSILTLLSKNFLLLVLLGNLIAWPVAWYAANQWLQEFTYRINISWTVFATATGLTVLLALLTIAYTCIKAAMANPVKSLRSE